MDLGSGVTMESKDLPEALERQLEHVYGAAFAALKDSRGAEALESADAAWALMPEPKFQWSMSYLVAKLRIRAMRALGRHIEAAEFSAWCADATTVPDEKPVFEFYLGASRLDAGDNGLAYEAFASSWAKGGKFGFKREDKRYLEWFLAERARA